MDFRDYRIIDEGCDGLLTCLVVWSWTQDRLVAATPFEFALWEAAWAPDGREILVGDEQGQVFRWDVNRNDLALSGAGTPPIRAMAYSPSGTKALVAYQDGHLQVWDSRANLWTSLDQPLVTPVSAATWLNDKEILLGGGEGAVHLWNGRTWTKVIDEREHLDEEVTSIARRPDAPEVLTTSRDGTTRVWRADNWELVDLLFNRDTDPNGFQNEVFDASWSPAGGHIINGTYDGVARLWTGRKVLAARLVERVCSIMADGDIQAEIPTWRGCEAELAAVADDLVSYKRVMGMK
jgi:WD40 repeat protein